jgi:hypothetical protein
MNKSSKKYSNINDTYIKYSNEQDKTLTWTFIGICMLVIVLALAILGTVGFAEVISLNNRLDKHRYCVVMTNTEIYDDPGGGDPSGLGVGYIEIDLHDKEVSFNLLFGGIGNVSLLTINGPVDSSNVYTADIYFPTNGQWLNSLEPNSNGEYKGKQSISLEDGKDIVSNPTRYYLLLNTTDYPLGSIGDRLGRDCTPNI